MRKVLIFSLCVSVQLVWAQSTNIASLFKSPFEKAEIQYEHLAYRNALELYLYAMEKDPANLVIQDRIADCYVRLGQIDEAARWYGLLANNPQSTPLHKYHYGQVLSIQGKYADAQQWFSQYMAAERDNPQAQMKHDFIFYISYYYRDSLLYNIENQYFNSDQSDFAPTYFKNGVVFMSARDRDLFIKKRPTTALNDNEAMLNLYYSSPTPEGDDAEPLEFEELNTAYHDGPVAFFDGEKQVVFTRSNMKGKKAVASGRGRVNLKLYFARIRNDGKLGPVESFQYNHDDYSISHPWVSEDGSMLYFVSDMPGGYGGTDIYFCKRDGNSWSKPTNLGNDINTIGNEFYPYLVNDSTMYFASNGHGGLGGLDLYVSEFRDGKFSFPENLGYPLNSSHDDFALIADQSGRTGYFSTNRAGGKGYDDIYSFKVKSFFMVGRSIDRNDSTKGIPNAIIHVSDTLGNRLFTLNADDEGYFSKDLDFDQDYVFTAEKENHEMIAPVRYSTWTRAMGVDSFKIALWRQNLQLSGRVFSNESQQLLPGTALVLKNLSDGTERSIITDSTGTYQFKLIPERRYVLSATKHGFLDNGFNLNTKGIYSGDLKNDILMEERFVEKALVLFELNKHRVDKNYFSELDQLVHTLKKNAAATLYIGAHADAQGTNEYNLRLSNRRAAELVKYFVGKGIASSRIEAIGFGEELLLNRCSDGVECHETEHQYNRRAEIKVQMPEDES